MGSRTLLGLAMQPLCAVVLQGCGGFFGSVISLADPVDYARGDVVPVQMGAVEVGIMARNASAVRNLELGYVASVRREGDSYLRTAYIGYKWYSGHVDVGHLTVGLVHDQLRLVTRDGTESGSGGSLGGYIAIEDVWVETDEGTGLWGSSSTCGLRYVFGGGPDVLGGRNPTGRLAFTIKLVFR